MWTGFGLGGNRMTNQEAVNDLKVILSEITECEESICYITDVDAEPLRLAIKALERQIPKKPIYGAANIKCPNCGATLLYYFYSFKIDYCDECGQRLDWSEENDE